MELEHNHLIQALMKKHWISAEALPLLRLKSHGDHQTLVTRLLDYGLTSMVIFEAARDVAQLRGAGPFSEVLLDLIIPPSDPKITGLLMEREMRGHFVAPLYLQGNSLKIAMADPTDERIIETLKLRALYEIDIVLAPADQFEDYINRLILAENEHDSSEEDFAESESFMMEEVEEELEAEGGREGRESVTSDLPAAEEARGEQLPGFLPVEPPAVANLGASPNQDLSDSATEIDTMPDQITQFTPAVGVKEGAEGEFVESEQAPLLSEEVNEGVVAYLNQILIEAIELNASDIHFEPYEESYRIRFRVDGVLKNMFAPKEEYREQLAARLKILAELDIAERRRPQDGRIQLTLDDKDVDARISVIPTIWGEKVVVRILNEQAMPLSIEKLGLNEAQTKILYETLNRPQGMILVTGPTGSGKTVTLYSCLNYLNEASRNIATAEDPVEIYLKGVNQLQVNPTIGLTFAEALRAFLRQDPDVLMVGEVRDYETADIAIKSAQTGHLLLSTLHTNSAPESLARLLNMGVEPYNIASTVKLVISQRLVRKLCHCKVEDVVDSHYLESLGFSPMQAASRIYRANGCSECQGGYRGRIGLFEVMPVSSRVEQMILEGATTPDIRAQIEREGVKTLRQSGVDKIVEGLTSLEEVLRVTPH